MTFVSLAYLLLLPAVFLLYRTVLAHSVRGQNVLLLAASYLFYGWWDWRFLALLAGLTLTSWACALPRRHRRVWAAVNVAICIAALVAFKYCGFFAENLRWLLRNFGWEMDWFTVEVLVPVGLSFYALQAIGYSVDVARGTVSPERSLPVLALYISFFPQLVAGPIEQASSMLPQLRRPRPFDYAEAVDGCRRILWGFFKKIVVADGLARWVDWAFGTYDKMDGPWASVRLGACAMLFAVQIYADFSGYSDIAVGSARLLGIRLTDNFRFPFFSRDGRELWTRWHRSLYLWLRTYIYIPLGGSRRGSRYAHVLAVFILSGLWHGAAWTYVVWGVLCGLWVCLSMWLHPGRVPSEPASRADLPRVALTFMAFAVVFIVFRSQSVAGAYEYMVKALPGLAVLTALIAAAAAAVARVRWVLPVAACGAVAVYAMALAWLPAMVLPESIFYLPWIAALFMFAMEWRSRRGDSGMCRAPRSRVWRAVMYVVLAVLSVSGAATSTSGFIYFQF